MDYTEILNWLKNNLNEERYFHTLGTAECAKELANKLKADLDSMTFAEGFNKDQLLFYIDYLLESYAEEK